jgi:hypothetical protein
MKQKFGQVPPQRHGNSIGDIDIHGVKHAIAGIAPPHHPQMLQAVHAAVQHAAPATGPHLVKEKSKEMINTNNLKFIVKYVIL